MNGQLSPYEQFLIHRTLTDPNDANTYYVQAVIRDADDTIVETVNLTDRGNQRFSKQWKVAADRSVNGSGRYISITTRVYTDSGYTTPDTLNGQESQTYIIQRRLDSNVAFGGGGGVIDYREISKIVTDEIKKIPKLELPKQEAPKPTDFTPIIKEITKNITDRIDKIKIPEPEKIDFRPIEKGLENLSKDINNLPRFEKTDLSELIMELQNLNYTIAEKEKFMRIIEENTKLKTIFSAISTMGIGGLVEEAQKKSKDNYLLKLKSQFGL